jgi:hypothetical protein
MRQNDYLPQNPSCGKIPDARAVMKKKTPATFVPVLNIFSDDSFKIMMWDYKTTSKTTEAPLKPPW